MGIDIYMSLSSLAWEHHVLNIADRCRYMCSGYVDFQLS